MRRVRRPLLFLLVALSTVLVQTGGHTASAARLPPTPGEGTAAWVWHRTMDPEPDARHALAHQRGTPRAQTDDVMIVVDLIQVGLY